MKIKREEFVDLYSQKGYTKKDSAVILDDFILTLKEILADGKGVSFHGFGSFEVVDRSGKKMMDYQSKEIIEIPAYKAVKFTPGDSLRRSVKEGFVRV